MPLWRRTGALAIAVGLANSCRNNSAPQRPWTFAEHVGVVAQKLGKECLEIRNSSLPPNSPVYLITTAAPQNLEEGRIVNRDESCRNPTAETPEYQPYEIRLGQKSRHGLMPVIAVVNYDAGFEKREALLEADLDRDGQPEHFRSCVSAEGIHFTVWTGPPLTGKLRWHQYYYLGYDVSPDCTPQEASSAVSR